MPLSQPVDDKRQERRERRRSVAAPQTETILSEEKMLAIPESRIVGLRRLIFTCPTIRQAGEIQNALYREWPDVLLFAATGAMDGEGIDPKVIADLMTISRRAAWTVKPGERQEDRGAMPAEVTINEVRGEISRLGFSIASLLPSMATSVWELVKDTEWLSAPADLEEHFADLTLPQLCDFLRACLACMGGFPGDAADRFPQSPETGQPVAGAA